MKNYEILYMKD